MYLNFTKTGILAGACLISSSLMAKDVVPAVGQGFKKPICFIENKGQVVDNNNNPRTDIQYKLSTPGVSLYLGKGQLQYQFRRFEGKDPKTAKARIYNANVKLIGADPNARVEAMDMQEYYENYYSPRLGENGLTVHSYNKVVYHDVYPGIDWVLYVNEGKVEYDFVVRPGADASKIRIAYEGAKLKLQKSGSITAVTPMGEITEKKPVSYEKATGAPIASSFVLNGNEVGFKTAPHNGTLVIDPYILWSTYYGGASEDVVTAVKVSSTAFTFVGGHTKSTTGIGFAPGEDLSFNGAIDAFVARYSNSGNLQWATYWGGGNDDVGTCLALNSGTTAVFLGGYTASGGLSLATGPGSPVWHANNNGLHDGFVVRFSATAGTRVWASYWGGPGEDYVRGIALDNAGNPCITGQTESATQVTSSPGVYQAARNGAADAFLAKFNGATGAINFSTYYGGSAIDEGFGIACDALNNIIFSGQTSSASGMSTTGAHQTALSGTNDAFIAKFNAAGTTRTWGTYFGGTGTEAAKQVACHPTTDAIAIVGNTTSSASISTSKAHQPTYGGGLQDGFVSYFTSAGVQTWGSYYGGSNVEYGEAVCFDKDRNVVIAGATFSTNGIASAAALQPAIGGDYDAFVAKFNLLGQRIWGTYFGKADYDYAYSVAVDVANGEVAIGGYTSSNTGIATTGVQQTVYGGGLYDGFVTKLTRDTSVFINQPYNDTLLCANGTFNLPYTANNFFGAANTFTAQLSNAAGSFAAPTNIGVVSSTTTGSIPITIPSSIVPGNGYRIRIVASNPAFISPDNYFDIKILAALPPATVTANSPVCVGGTLNLGVTTTYTVSSYNWTGPAGSGFSSPLPNPSIVGVALTNAGAYTVVTSHVGCPSRSDDVTVVVNSVIPPTPTVTSSSPVCNLGTLNLFATPGTTGTITYSWTGPGGFTSTMQNPTISSITSTGSGVYNLVDVVDGCQSAVASVTVTVIPNSPVALSITASPGDIICQGDTVTFTATAVNGGVTPAFQWYKNGTVIGATGNVWTAPGLINNDKIFATVVSNTVCPLPSPAFSNTITMTVINSAPIAYIAVTPAASVAPGTTVTFTSTVYNAGTTPLYQWKKNGVNIPGATNSTYVMVSSGASETITLQFTNTMQCAIPSTVLSNSITIHSNVGVTEMNSSIDKIALFPNPNKGSFTIHGDVEENIGAISFKVLNPLGQVVHTGDIAVKQGTLYEDVNLSHLADGMYLLHVNANGQTKVIRFSIQH